MIGLRPEELAWVRLLVSLLRHPDPMVVGLSQQALQYVEEVVQKSRLKDGSGASLANPCSG